MENEPATIDGRTTTPQDAGRAGAGPTMKRPSTLWIILLSILGVIILAMSAMIYIGVRDVSPYARDWVVQWMQDRYQSQVDLQSFKIRVYPRIHIEGAGLALHFQGRTDIPPIIAIRHFSVDTGVLGLLHAPRHVEHVHLDGMQLNIPPRGEGETPNLKSSNSAPSSNSAGSSVVIDLIESAKVMLIIRPNLAKKEPQDYDISHLTMRADGNDSMNFHATLSNPVPPGDILTSGNFGPWDSDDPGSTPVSGSYTYDHADLGYFQGIAGILSSKGQYKGELDNLTVDGTTDVPDFRVLSGNHKVHLMTTFHAIVDGTNGDTYLQPVTARFNKTVLLTQGSVEGTPGKPGKTITLNVTATQGRIEDLLLLAVKDEPALTGDIQLKTKFVLPPGPSQISDKLFLDGNFNIDSAHFTSSNIREKVDTLSNKSQGNTQPPGPDENIASQMHSKFRLKNGVITFEGLAFSVPGAQINLDGTYTLNGEALDLYGQIAMQAKLSQMTHGVKSFFLKAVDPFFSKNGHGTVLPIKITGDVKHPSYGLDFHHKKDKAASSGN